MGIKLTSVNTNDSVVLLNAVELFESEFPEHFVLEIIATNQL